MPGEIQKILIVEDEPKVASFIKRGLEEQSFDVEVAFDGDTGSRLAQQGKFDAVILDVNLPNKNGYEIARELRTKNNFVPVLMLTALGTTDDKISGFDSGADDYLVKPFEFRELLARVKALLKRSRTSHTEAGSILTVSDLEMNLENRIVKRNGQKIELTAKEFSLLEYFIRNKGKVLTRSDIASKVWDINFDTGTNVIDVYVNFLRKKIDRGFNPKLIHTQVGVGYVLRAE